MGIYLETFLDTHPDAKYLFTEDLDPKAPTRMKGTYLRVGSPDNSLAHTVLYGVGPRSQPS